MPVFGTTPETLLGRNDSKNPATTCRGITGSGRPCRRALASSTRQRTPSASGVMAVIEDNAGDTGRSAEFYCWQHKDQVITQVVDIRQENSSVKQRSDHSRRPTQLYAVDENTSLETMVQRLGIQDDSSRQPKPTSKSAGRLHEEHLSRHEKPQRTPKQTNQQKKLARPGFWASLCCMSVSDNDDYVEIVRHRNRVERSQQPMRNTRTTVPQADRTRVKPTHQYGAAQISDAKSHPQTGEILSLIPKHLPPQIVTNLLNELVKPISPNDEEGYIYIFWLTPQDNPPDASAAQSLLLPPSDPNIKSRRHLDRRISDVMTEFSFRHDEPSTSSKQNKRTIMLKIGRANNVTRRMNEWQRQCGYAVSLIRWYPYVSTSTPGTSPSPSPAKHHQRTSSSTSESPYPLHNNRSGQLMRKVPSVKRVERLVHLELAGTQVTRQCENCGREHREWFEVEASQLGIKQVDDCIKRWVNWAEQTQTRL